MMNSKLKYLQVFIFALAAIVFLVSCQKSPNLTGKWQEVGKTATLEFRDDHTFSAVDNMGMSVSGKYYLDNSGKMRFEIKHGEPEAEIIIVKVTVRDDELTVIYGYAGEVENYRRVKP
jgi:hypothetical protein